MLPIRVIVLRFAAGVTVTQDYDGDGQRVKQGTGNQSTYYVRSSALGGAVVYELILYGGNNPGWHKEEGFVYANGQMIAQQSLQHLANQPRVDYLYTNPITHSQRGTTVGAEYDPMENPIGLAAPEPDTSTEQVSDLVIPRYADALNLTSGCEIDGAAASCDAAASAADAMGSYDRQVETSKKDEFYVYTPKLDFSNSSSKHLGLASGPGGDGKKKKKPTKPSLKGPTSDEDLDRRKAEAAADGLGNQEEIAAPINLPMGDINRANVNSKLHAMNANIDRVLKNNPDLLRTIIANNLTTMLGTYAICHAAEESSLNPDALGSELEKGLFQLKWSTAKKYAEGALGKDAASKLKEPDLYDPAINTKIGTYYVQSLANQYGDFWLATGLFKYGEGNYAHAGNTLSDETQNYVQAIKDCWKGLDLRGKL
jgi:hypothetical protein